VALAHQAAALRVEVAQEGATRAPRQERRRERLELLADRGAMEKVLAVDEEQEQDRRASLGRQAGELTQAVDAVRSRSPGPEGTPSGCVRET
jgi:hypothetical protein